MYVQVFGKRLSSFDFNWFEKNTLQFARCVFSFCIILKSVNETTL